MDNPLMNVDVFRLYPQLKEIGDDTSEESRMIKPEKTDRNGIPKPEIACDKSPETDQQSHLVADGKVKKVDPETKKENRNIWRKLMVIFGVLDILIFVSILCLRFSATPNDIVTTSYYSDNFCVPCDAVYLTSDDNNDNIYQLEKRENGNTCCAGYTYSVTDVVTKPVIHNWLIKVVVTDKLYSKYRAKGFSHIPHVTTGSAIMKELDFDQSSTGNPLKWKSTPSLIGQDTYYQDGRIHVNVSGVYYVYSQLGFVDNAEKDTNLFNHSIWLRDSDNNKEKLMDIVHSECAMVQSKDGFIPSYHGRLFDLQAHEGVEVHVSDVMHVDRNTSNHYFGVFHINLQ